MLNLFSNNVFVQSLQSLLSESKSGASLKTAPDNFNRKRKNDEISDDAKNSKTQKLIHQEPSQDIITTIKNTPSTKDIPELKKSSYQEFIENLQFAKLHPSKELLKLISQSTLEQIYEYFILEQNKPLLDNIRALKPNQSIRLDKHVTGLSRTLNILRTHKGEYNLILETKSKLANGTKQPLPKIGGTTKKGKPAWRIDGEQKPYFNLVAILQNNIALDEIKEEVAISRSLTNQYIDTKQLGEKYTKKGITKISVYSEKAICDLETFMNSHTFKDFSFQQKYDLLLELLHGVKALHDQGQVHQDLKPGNILVYGDDKTGYHLKITDFGLTRPQEDPKTVESDAWTWAQCTLGYQSPEITFSFQAPNNPIAPNYKTYQSYYMNPNPLCYSLAHQQTQNQPFVIKPHSANDMWALGVIAYKMLHGKEPLLPQAQDNIAKNPLLRGLLEPNRDKRLNIEKACQTAQLMKTYNFGVRYKRYF